jgi:hypothetical protein
MLMSTVYKKHYKKSPNPVLHGYCWNKPVATNMVYSRTPAPSIDGGETAAQIFVGTESFATNV